MALTTHLRPMNFAQIWISPTDSLNGKSMGVRDNTSLKDNVSKCQLLGLRSSPSEFAVRAISMGLSGMKERQLGRALPGQRNPLCLWLSISFVHASSADPTLLTLFRADSS